jgi:hypothetical protein
MDWEAWCVYGLLAVMAKISKKVVPPSPLYAIICLKQVVLLRVIRWTVSRLIARFSGFTCISIKQEDFVIYVKLLFIYPFDDRTTFFLGQSVAIISIKCCIFPLLVIGHLFIIKGQICLAKCSLEKKNTKYCCSLPGIYVVSLLFTVYHTVSFKNMNHENHRY